jgi:putative ABC transport system permease protein
MLTESVLLAGMGGAGGLLLAWWGLISLLAITPADLPRVQEINLDGRVLLVTLALSLLTGIGFGLAPAFQFARQDIYATLKEGTRGTEGTRRSRLRRLLVVAEVALALVLLVGAGLLLRSFQKLQSVEPGFDPDEVLTMRIAPAGERYNDTEQVRAFYDQVLDRITALPGVRSAGAVSTLPLSNGAVAGFQIEGRPPVPPSEWQGANYRVVSPDYFRALSIPILEGRGFTSSDTSQGKDVVLINQALARRDFPNENPLGKRISFGTNAQGQPLWFEIVGIVADIRTTNLTKEPEPDFYAFYRQVSVGGMSLVIRADAQSESLVAAATGAVRDVDPDLPVADIQVMRQIVSESISQPRFNLFLLGAFACLAMLLAAAGIYGVMSYAVTQRTQEIGIRMALGARGSDVMKMVVRQGMVPALMGIAIGAGAALMLTRLMKSLLYGVSAADPLTFALIGLLLASVAFLACYLPARRATKVDPMIALRYE